MKRGLIHTLAIASATATLNIGCAWQAEGRGTAYAPVVFTQQPTLVAIEPGVSVVQDADYPVYWVDNSYWVYRDNAWYRSNSYEGGWVVVDVNGVPTTIAHRDHSAYVHYRGTPTAETHPAPRMPVVSSPERESHDHQQHSDEHPATGGHVVAQPDHDSHDHAAEQRGNGPQGHDTPAAGGHDKHADERVTNEPKKDDKRSDADKKRDDERQREVERKTENARKPDQAGRPDVNKKQDEEKKGEKK